MANPIGNPLGAAVSGGTLDTMGTGSRIVLPFVADGAISAKDAVAFTDTDTDTLPPVHAADTDTDNPAAVFGVALNTAAIGDIVMVVVLGPAIVNTTGAPAIGEVASPGTTAGVVSSGAADANTIVGDVLGKFMGDEIGTSDTAIVWVGGI